MWFQLVVNPTRSGLVSVFLKHGIEIPLGHTEVSPGAQDQPAHPISIGTALRSLRADSTIGCWIFAPWLCRLTQGKGEPIYRIIQVGKEL